MSENDDKTDNALSRREISAAGAAGFAEMALGAKKSPSAPARMPVAYVPHGGGPWPFVDLGMPKSETDSLMAYLHRLPQLPPQRPKALIVVSAHWEEGVPTVMSAQNPPLFFDYSGFPPSAYQLTWPAPGSPSLAGQVRTLLEREGFKTAENRLRGYDHGTFVPLKVAYPEADIPVVQLSLIKGLDPSEHLKMGHALAPLRNEGVFIVGSGMTFHNFRAFGSGLGGDRAAQFDAWLNEVTTAEPTIRDAQLKNWAQAPQGRFAHPREEHLIPLLVIAGAAQSDRGTRSWSGSFMGMAGSGFHFG